jgi:nitroreductase
MVMDASVNVSPEQSPLESLTLLEGMATTRAIRRYTNDPISEADLNSILWHASRAPSGSNRQAFRFVVLQNSDVAVQAKALLGSAFRRGWKAKVAHDQYDQGSGRDPNSPKARQAAAMQHYVDHFEDVPVVVLACLIRHRDENPYEGASVYPACQNLLLAARALGYGGVLTMWHHAVEDELRALLEIPANVALSACITLGRPQGRHGPVRRQPLKNFVFEDRWAESPAWANDPPGVKYTSAGPTG